MAADRNDVVEVAREIQAYIARRPNAADSLTGVVNWWLAGQHRGRETETVREALEYLVQQGVLRKVVGADNSITYSAARNEPDDQGQRS